MLAAKNVGFVARCQICGDRRLEEILSLGHQPIVQEYLKPEELCEPETTYPLVLVRCARCGLLQINYIVEPALVFPKHYPYRTGLTNMLIRNFQALAAELRAAGRFGPGDLVVDIGSNDGTLLKQFQPYGARIVGVEPTGAARVANRAGVPTIEDFFGPRSVRAIVKKYGKARIVTATNVFAHINDTPALVRNVAALMDARSVFVSESQYLMDIMEKLEFDTIYHEHLRFYALKPMAHMFRMHGLSLVDAERIRAAGGSIRVFVMKGKHSMSARAKKLIAAEEKAGLYDKKELLAFARRVHAAKNELLALLLRCKKKGARIVGLTSSARSNTLLGFCHIDHTVLEYACEKKGSPKIGLYTPGTHVPVVDEAMLFKEQPEYALVLSWHIGEELMKKVKAAGYRGKFIVPLPKARIAG